MGRLRQIWAGRFSRPGFYKARPQCNLCGLAWAVWFYLSYFTHLWVVNHVRQELVNLDRVQGKILLKLFTAKLKRLGEIISDTSRRTHDFGP